VQDRAPVSSPRSKLAALLVRGAAVAGLLYLLLLIPEREPAAFKGAGQKPFVWNQDLYWAELERQFVQARTQGCDTVLARIDTALNESGRLLLEISEKPLLPNDPSFGLLETNLFVLAPMLGACPQGLNDYIHLTTRLRTEVKKQSQHWDLNSSGARQTLYRLLFGTRMALEEAILQAPPLLQLAQPILDAPCPTPAADLLGVKVHSGDILVSRGGAPTSALIARGNDYPGNFSHAALLHVDEQTGRASVIESHIERGVTASSLAEYLKDKKLRIMVLRLRADLPLLKANAVLAHEAATKALLVAQSRHIPYDFSMNYRDHQAQFCSEVVSAAYEPVGINLWMGVSYISSPTVTAWLGSLGVRHFETQEPADLEYDPQLCVIAEWRDRATLFKAHLDDAVTDVMLDEARPGTPLDYPRLLLPTARIAKAFSLLLNALGRIGPIPEGMSATTALRVKSYRREHEAIATRALVLAEDFKLRKGYTPPYWELLKLARQAKHQTKP
jgi:hypothetical protein